MLRICDLKNFSVIGNREISMCQILRFFKKFSRLLTLDNTTSTVNKNQLLNQALFGI